MKKRSAKDLRDFVKKQILEWKPKLFLTEWTIDVIFATENLESSKDAYVTLADVVVNTPYLKAIITIYPSFHEQPIDVQKDALVHELCHIISQPVFDIISRQQQGLGSHPHEASDVIETLTQRITNIAMRKN